MAPASSFRRIVEIARARAFLIAAGFACVVTLTVCGVFALMYWQVTSANLVQIRHLLEDESADAVDTPVEQIRQQLALRLTRDLRRLDFVGLFDAKGASIYGNYDHPLPVPVDGIAHLTSVALRDGSGGSEAAVFIARRRRDGGVLMLGRSLVGVYRLRAAMSDSFRSAVVPVVLVAIISGLVASLAATRRLATMREAIRRVMAGELDARLPADRRSDDVGHLSRDVNLMLDEIGRLVTQIKSVGDNIAHDLRTPLAASKAQLERGLAASDFGPLRSSAQDALSGIDRALTAASALLRISELESGVRRTIFAEVDIVATCHESLDLFAPFAEAKGIDLTMQAPASLAVMGDAALLQEVFVNLIDNALKFTPRGGRVELQVGVDGAPFRISDSGPGIPIAERQAIFKRFYRGAYTTRTPGSGIGLSLAATIAELHGFSLAVIDTGAIGATLEMRPADHPFRHSRMDGSVHAQHG